MTMVAWMMNITIGSAGLYLVGLRPSKIPACAGARSVAVACDAVVAAAVTVTTTVAVVDTILGTG